MTLEVHQLDGLGKFHNISDRFEYGLYPGGEPWVKLSVPTGVYNVPTLVVARIKCLTDLGYFNDLVRCLYAAGVDRVSAFIPYFPGARSDRVTVDEVVMPKGLDLYATVVNGLKLAHVFVLDPHSNATPYALSDCIEISPGLAVEWHVEQFDTDGYAAVIAPDAGASQRARLVASRLGVPVYDATKVRNMATGKLTGFKAPSGVPTGHILIVDDICDGGGTFAGLLGALERNYAYYYKWDLFVTHGIFSGNAKKNLSRFSRVLTTDSLQPDGPPVTASAPISIYYDIIAKEMA